jgi:hypothetical protein
LGANDRTFNFFFNLIVHPKDTMRSSLTLIHFSPTHRPIHVFGIQVVVLVWRVWDFGCKLPYYIVKKKQWLQTYSLTEVLRCLLPSDPTPKLQLELLFVVDFRTKTS